MTATKSLDLLFPDSAESNMVSPFSGICIEEQVQPWDELTIRELITHRLSDKFIQFSETEIKEIIKKSLGNPRQVVLLCYNCYGRYQRLG